MGNTADGRKIIILLVAVAIAYWLLLPRPSPKKTSKEFHMDTKVHKVSEVLGGKRDRFSEHSFDKESVKKGADQLTDTTLSDKQELEQSLHEQINDFKTQLQDAKSKIRSLENSLEEERNKQKTGKQQAIVTKPFSGHRLVHLDLKGAPPNMEYLLKLIPLIKMFGGSGFLIEYEDMFPFQDDLHILQAKHAYKAKELETFLGSITENNLIVVPLVQTFGHIEYVLKHKKFSHLRETAQISNSICPLKNESRSLIKSIITQILNFHKDIKWIHLGGDEVWNLKSCRKCMSSSMSAADLYLHHMIPLFDFVNKLSKGKIKPIIWDDMMRHWSISDLSRMSAKVEPMVWGYVSDLSTYPKFPADMWYRYVYAFKTIWFASSFKGALLPYSNFVPLKQHIMNHESWIRIMHNISSKINIQGIALTGWSRFDHYGPLCELLPAAIPSLALCLGIIEKGSFSTELHEHVSNKLGFTKPFVIDIHAFKRYIPEEATYAGHDIYTLVGNLQRALGWYNWAKHVVNGWTRPFHLKAKHLSFYHLNVSVGAADVCMNSLTELKADAKKILSQYFTPRTVLEWIDDKIVYNYEEAKNMKLRLIKIIKTNEFK